jgi:NADH-quinone oxidoreductase subunit L
MKSTSLLQKKILFGLIAKPARGLIKILWMGMVNLTGSATQLVSEKIKGVQSGKIQQYAIYFLLGTIVLASIFIYWWK